MEQLGPPEMRTEGNDFIFTWDPTAIQVKVTDMTTTGRDGPRAEVWVRDLHTGHLHTALMNLLSTSSRQTFVREMKAREPELPWKDIVEQFSVMSVEAQRAGSPMSLLEPRKRPASEAFVVDPLIPTGVPTLLFGDGSAGKSYLANAIGRATALGIPIAGMRAQAMTPAYLDWEWDEEEHADRLYQLGADVSYFYRQCTVPLAQQVKPLLRLLDANGVNFVIIDSLGYACGGDILLPNVILPFFAAVRALNRTTLITHHVSKEKNRDPYGSVYIRNSVRSAWYLAKSTLPEPDGFCAALRHNKTNRGKLREPIGLQFHFTEDTTRIERTNPSRVAELTDSAPSKKAAIIEVLRTRSGLTSHDLANALGDDVDRIAVHLSQLKRQGRVQNNDARWALRDDQHTEGT